MQETRISYTKKHLNIILIQALVWFVIFGLNRLLDGEDKLSSYLWLLIGLGYLSIYGYCSSQKYLTINDSSIQINSLFGKKIAFQEIARVKYFAGDLLVKSHTGKTLTINTGIISPEALELLRVKLQDYQEKPILTNP